MRDQTIPRAPLRGARKDPIGVFCSTRLSIDDQMLKKMRSRGAPHYRSKHLRCYDTRAAQALAHGPSTLLLAWSLSAHSARPPQRSQPLPCRGARAPVKHEGAAHQSTPLRSISTSSLLLHQFGRGLPLFAIRAFFGDNKRVALRRKRIRARACVFSE